MLQEFNSITAQFACKQPLKYVYGVLHYCSIAATDATVNYYSAILEYLFSNTINYHKIIKNESHLLFNNYYKIIKEM